MSDTYEEFFENSPGAEGYELGETSLSPSLSPQKEEATSLSPEQELEKGLESFKERVESVRKSIEQAERRSKSLSPIATEVKSTVIVYRGNKVLENPKEYKEGDLVEVPMGIKFVRAKTEKIVASKLTAKSEFIVEQTKKFEELKKGELKSNDIKKFKKQLNEMWRKLPQDEKNKYKKKAQETKNKVKNQSKLAFIKRNVLTAGGKRVQQKVELGKLDITELRAMIPDDVEGVKKMKRAELVKYIKDNSMSEDLEIDYDLEKVDDRAQALLLAMKDKGKDKEPSEVLQTSMEVVEGQTGKQKKKVNSLDVGQKEAIVEVIVAKKPEENVSVAYTSVYRFLVYRPKVINLQDPQGKTVKTTVYTEIPFRSKVIFDEIKNLKSKSKENLIEILRKYSQYKKKALEKKTDLQLKYLLAGAKRGIKIIEDATLGPVIKDQLKLAKDAREVRAIIENFDLPIDKSDPEEKMRKNLKRLANKLSKNINKKKLLRNGVPVPGVIPMIPGEQYEFEYIPEVKLVSAERRSSKRGLVPITGVAKRHKIVKEQKKGFADIVRIVVTLGSTKNLEAGDKLSIRHKDNAFNGAVIHKVGTHCILSGIFIENANVFAQLPPEEKRKAPSVILDMNLLKDSVSIDGPYFGHFLGDIRERTDETITAISTFLPFRRSKDYQPHLEEKHKIKTKRYGEVEYDSLGRMKAPNYYGGITKYVSPKQLAIAKDIKLKVRTLDDILSSPVDNAIFGSVQLSLKNTLYGLFGRLKDVKVGEGEVLTPKPDEDLDKLLERLYGHLRVRANTIGKLMKIVAPLMVFLSKNLIGDNAKIFKAKVKSGMYAIENLDRAKMYHFLPELYMNNKLSGVDLKEAEEIINNYIRNVTESFISSVYGLRAKQRGEVRSIKKYLISPEKICKTIDGKPVEEGRVVICEQDGEFYCLSVDQVIDIIERSKNSNTKPVNPLTGKQWSNEFVREIEERYKFEMNMMEKVINVAGTPSPRVSAKVSKKKTPKGKMIVGKIEKVTLTTPPKKLSDRKKARLYRKFVERWGYDFGTYNEADIKAIEEGTGLDRMEQKTIKEKAGYFKYASLQKPKTLAEAREQISPRTREALVDEAKVLKKAGLRAPPVAELREMVKELKFSPRTQEQINKEVKREVKHLRKTLGKKDLSNEEKGNIENDVKIQYNIALTVEVGKLRKKLKLKRNENVPEKKLQKLKKKLREKYDEILRKEIKKRERVSTPQERRRSIQEKIEARYKREAATRKYRRPVKRTQKVSLKKSKKSKSAKKVSSRTRSPRRSSEMLITEL